jgi:hypothetical protein
MTETFTIVNSQPSMVEALEAVQRAAFPTLAEDEIITAAHYAAHIARFPEGQFAVLNAAGQVVACSTDFRTSAVDFNAFEHRYIDAVASNWLSRHVVCGLLTGFSAYKAVMSVEEYVAKILSGELVDPTVSVQLRCGFSVHGIIHNYVHDPACDGKAVFLAWYNPDYDSARRL